MYLLRPDAIRGVGMLVLGPQEYHALMTKLAQAWSRQDTESALECFTSDAVYFEPPDVQFYHGQEQLRSYFGALTPGTFMVFHHLSFDESNQVGAGEFSFGLKGKSSADHGVVIVKVRDGKIASWCEYPSERDRLLSKTLSDWTARNGNGTSVTIHESLWDRLVGSRK